ncbi:hypothetical protein F511_39615 [Dorcoceras hygrometricum]|uniref:Uncharacterized protein n=1 Tax=Dorcoceras hygrometricum TaxID=472368 RepID=A0A2Z7BH86_9LAMI|nr:hypothetical protein F511_39615 [Dorcoceras hygrometricum]
MLQNTTRLCQSCNQKLNSYLDAQILPQQISPGHDNLSLLKSSSSLVSVTTAGISWELKSRSPKLKGEKNRLEIVNLLESATTPRSSYVSIYNSKLLPIERANQDEFSASNLAPNNGGNRRQSTGEGFDEQYRSRVSLGERKGKS